VCAYLGVCVCARVSVCVRARVCTCHQRVEELSSLHMDQG